MPPRKIPTAPSSSRPKRARRPSARAIEAAEHQAAADRLAASRKKPRLGNVGATQAPQVPQAPQAAQPGRAQQSQTQQAQTNPVNASAPAPLVRPYAPFPPPVPQVLAAPVPPYAPLPPAPAALLPLPILPPAPLQPVPLPSMPPAALAQAQAGPVYRTFQDAITYEPDSYHHLFYYFNLEERLQARVGPLIRRDELKPPILGLILPPCHDYDPPTPNNPDPDDIEPSRRRYYGGGGGNGNDGGGHAGAGVAPGASRTAPQPPQQARSQQQPPSKQVLGKRSRAAMGTMPQLERRHPETPVDLSMLMDVSAHSPTIVLDSASEDFYPPRSSMSSSKMPATMLPPPAPSAFPAPVPLILVDAASDDGVSAGEMENAPRWPATPLVIRLERASVEKGAQTARAAYGRDLGWDVSCARVGCPHCCYAACPCACHKNAFSAFMAIDRGRQKRRVDFNTALTKVIAEAADLTVGDPRNRCAVAAATVVPAMPPMLAVQMVGGENNPTDPGSADAELEPDRPSRKRRKVSTSRNW